MPSSSAYPRNTQEGEYNNSLKKIKSFQTSETIGFDPSLKTFLLTHGKKTKKAILWLHGYTSGTLQFKPLAELCFKAGFNVLVPCLPHHGMKDRLSDELSKIKMKELILFTTTMVDLMHGLGDEIVIGGLSMGGVMTAWAAQHRADVSLAIIIAPFLGAHIIPPRLTSLVVAGLGILPDIRQWWDPEKKMNTDGPQYGYLQHSTKSLRQIIKMGMKVRVEALRNPPAAGKVFMVINDHDQAVNNEICQELADSWKRSGAKNVIDFHFPDLLKLPHNCVGVEMPGANTKIVYAVLMKMVEGREIK
jgi:esterase/lipase